MTDTSVRLYHGSNAPIEHPTIAHNTGFADLGRGFYLTDDLVTARTRAQMRARGEGGTPTVSVFDLDHTTVTWVCWGEQPRPVGEAPDKRFGLCFDEDAHGFTAWANYIKACRRGDTTVPGYGHPAIVRAWLATMEIEMVYTDFMSADEFGRTIDPSRLTVQYCILDEALIGTALRFVEALV